MSSEADNKVAGSGEAKYSTGEVFSDAKYVTEAAKAALRKEKIDKAEAADAAGDLLDAGGQYAKLDDTKGMGQYVDKASDYLHDYQTKAKPTTAAAAAAPPPTSKPDEPKKDDDAAGGAFGGVAKLAGGFFK